MFIYSLSCQDTDDPNKYACIYAVVSMHAWLSNLSHSAMSGDRTKNGVIDAGADIWLDAVGITCGP